MQEASGYFKDEVIHGISLSLKYLQHLQAEATKSKIEGFGITKQNPYLQNLATYLDLTFSFGLKDPKKGYWGFVKNFVHSATRDLIEKHVLSTSEKRKGQIWLYLCLIENTLCSHVELFSNNKKHLNHFYKKTSLLRDQECCEILKTLLQGLDNLTLVLDINQPYLGYETEAIKTGEDCQDSFAFETKDCGNGTLVTTEDNKETVIPNHSPDKQVRFEDECSDLVIHLRRGRRQRTDSEQTDNSKLQRSVSHEGDGESVVESIDLEDDHYIPEVENSTPITVSFIVPDNNKNLGHASLSETSFVKDETVYNDFLLAYQDTNVSSSPKPEIFLGDELLRCEKDQVDGIEQDSGHDVNDDGIEVDGRYRDDSQLTSTGADEDVYRITYVSDDEGSRLEVPNARKRSIDSFDEFCRKRSETEETGEKDDSSLGDEFDQDIDRTDLEDLLPVQDDAERGGRPLDGGSQLKLMELSPHYLPKASISRVINARLDTSVGILLPTLPRRPTVKEAVKLAHDFSADQKTVVILSLEIFESQDEQFGKLFRSFLGSLHGIHEAVQVVLTNKKVYILRQIGEGLRGLHKEFSFGYDSINKIETGMNFQDVNIRLDDGHCHLWTCDEIATRNLVTSLKSGIKCGRSKDVPDEPLGQHVNNELNIMLRDFLLTLEDSLDFDLFYFGIVHFCCIQSEEEPASRLIKNGYLQRKQNYLGMVGHWDTSFFSLRGAYLYEYSEKEREQPKHVLDLRTKCGGCTRSKEKDKAFSFRIFGKDGMTSILELAAESEEDANDWIVSVCQVMADVKIGQESLLEPGHELMQPCGLALTSERLYAVEKRPQSTKFRLIAVSSLQDITRVCVDNEERDYCALILDIDDGEYNRQKCTWLLKFETELELGKFEQHVFACWHVIYQIPLQFVLMSDGVMKRNFRRILERRRKGTMVSIDDALRL